MAVYYNNNALNLYNWKMKLPNSPYIFLLDLDNSLIDTGALKQAIFVELADFIKESPVLLRRKSRRLRLEFVEGVYEKIRQSRHLVSPSALAEGLSVELNLSKEDLIRAYLRINPGRYLLPGAQKLVRDLARDNHIIFYTEGDTNDQLWKIDESQLTQGLPNYIVHNLKNLKENNPLVLDLWMSSVDKSPLVLVDESKTGLEALAKTLAKSGREIMIVDDKPDVIRDAIRIQKETQIRLIPIWMRRGQYARTIGHIEGSLTFDSPAQMRANLESSLRPGYETRVFHWPAYTRR